jgi:hypothetical protein
MLSADKVINGEASTSKTNKELNHKESSHTEKNKHIELYYYGRDGDKVFDELYNLFDNYVASTTIVSKNTESTTIVDGITFRNNPNNSGLLVQYANNFIVKNIIEKNGRFVEYVLNSDNCEESQQVYGDKHIKNLNMLWDHYDVDGYDPYNTLIIDDLKMVCKIQPHNSIQIKSFNTRSKDCLNDKELKDIRKKLTKISKHFKKDINKETLKFKLVPKL